MKLAAAAAIHSYRSESLQTVETYVTRECCQRNPTHSFRLTVRRVEGDLEASSVVRLAALFVALALAGSAYALPTGDYAFDIQLPNDDATYIGTFHNDDEIGSRLLTSIVLPGSHTFAQVMLDIVHPTRGLRNGAESIRLNQDGTGILLVRWDWIVGPEFAHIYGRCPAEIGLPDCPWASFQGNSPPMYQEVSYTHYLMTDLRPIAEPELRALAAAAMLLAVVARSRLSCHE